MPVAVCQIKLRLLQEAQRALARLGDLASQQIEALRREEYEAVSRLDGQIELSVGEKERALGALRQHHSEHHCGNGPDASSGAAARER